MNPIELKELMIEELIKEIPTDRNQDRAALRELALTNMNEPLVDKLVAKFCKKNPDALAVLKPFDTSDLEQNGTETVESIRYRRLVNNAGLAYCKNELEKKIQEFCDLV
jgi:hypothetical protein